MLSQDIQSVLQPFKLMLSKNALNPVYRAIKLSPTDICACLSWGVLEVSANLGLNVPVTVDRATFLSVVQSLPKAHELSLKTDGTSLLWVCGNARGRIAIMAVQEMPTIDWPEAMHPFPPDLPKALELGSIACWTTALAAIGMFGIVIDTRVGVVISSTDNASLSAASIGGDLIGATDTVSTLSPDGAELLGEVMTPDGVLGFSETAWYYTDEVSRCKIILLPAMKSDIAAVRNKFITAEIVVPIPHDAIGRFIKRANALAEVKRNASVTLSVKGGNLVLGFKEGPSTTDEYFLIDAAPDMPEIVLSATKLARALTHVTELVLDHINRGVLLFRGQDRDVAFEYLLCGKLVSNERT